MDAPILRYSLITLSLFISTGANYQTRNFTVTAPTPEVAKQVGDAAEIYRRDLAQFWIGQPLPNWGRPCKLKVRPGSMGAGGETKFQFVGNEVINWDMYVQGSLERILDSVLPHEVNHTIFACHFRRPLPRWADEGAATLFEHRSEQVKQLALLNQVLKNPREFISLRRLLTMKEYPKGYRPMLILYAEGYALADFLIQQGGRARYLKFMKDGERMGWTQAIKANYHHGGVDELQKNWRSWVVAGMPRIKVPNAQNLAAASETAARRVARGLGVPRPAILDEYLVNTTVRLQSPDVPPSVAVKPTRGDASLRAAPAVTQETPTTSPAAALHDAGLFPKREAVPPAAKRANSSRRSSFEAPRPGQAPAGQSAVPRRPITSSRTGQSFITRNSRVPQQSGLQRLEATGLIRNQSSSPRKHLPQERRAVTGSIPQWAGFPGQKELF